jgi:glycosyltransferase involved in cell wall biosynthesis
VPLLSDRFQNDLTDPPRITLTLTLCNRTLRSTFAAELQLPFEESMNTKSVSIVLATRNRAELLAESLRHVAEIRTRHNLSFILVDNGSTDDTPAVFDRFVSDVPFRATRIFEGRPGVGHALQTGLKAATGDIVMFTDDDCYPQADIVDSGWNAFAEDPSLGVVGGRIMLYDPTDARVTIEESLAPLRFKPRTYIRAGAFHGANLSFRRRALEEAGGFDWRFGPGGIIGSGCDIDAVARVNLAGWACSYDPRIVTYHHHRRKAADVPALMRKYDIGRGAYLAKLLVQPRGLRIAPRLLLSTARRLARSPGTAAGEATGAIRFLRLHFSQKANERNG